MDSLSSPVIILMLLQEELSVLLMWSKPRSWLKRENQGWTDNHLQGTNNIQLVNSISLDSLLNRLDGRAKWKRDRAIIEHYSRQRAATPCEYLHDAKFVIRGMLNLFLMMVGMVHRHKQHIRSGICATIKVILLVIYLLIPCLNILFLIMLELMRI